MATLLQQKNCMKSLTNGGGGGNGGNAGQGTRVLLPHEMVSIPISPMTTSSSTLSTGVSTVQHHHNQTLQQQQQQPTQFSNYNFYNSIHSNSDSANVFRQPSTSTINLQHPHHISHNSTLTSSVPFMNQSDHSDHSDTATTSCTDDMNGDQIKTEVKLEDDVIENSEQNLIQQMDEDEQEPEPEIDIVINNVVCSFSVRCHLNLREIALNGINVEFRRENGMVTMKLRRPYTTASIWSSGRITCTGATSEDQVR